VNDDVVIRGVVIRSLRTPRDKYSARLLNGASPTRRTAATARRGGERRGGDDGGEKRRSETLQSMSLFIRTLCDV
jgi:hypothetical protein